DAATLRAHLRVGADRDDLVEARLAADLVEERNLRDGQRRRMRLGGLLLAPAQVLPRNPGMEQGFEPIELAAVAEHDLRDRSAVHVACVLEHMSAPAVADRRSDLLVGLQELVDDLVARDDGCSVLGERLQGLALPRADSAGDRDRDGPRQRYSADSGSLVGSSAAAGSAAASGSAVSASASAIGSSSATGSSSTGASVSAAGSSSSTASTSTGAPSSEKTSSERSRSVAPTRCSLPSTRLSESERRRRSASTSRISTLTLSPCETTSRGFSTWCCASSEMWTRPSTPGRISTKAPKVTTFVTLPSTVSPSL